MCSVLGANLSWADIRPYFMHPVTNKRIHIVLDACNMIKLCRNTLGDWKYFYDAQGQEIKWSFFGELVKIQNESGFHAATKIRNRHLNYHKEKMCVKLAAEMFSASVADAIEYCDKDLDIQQFRGSEALVRQCRYMNDIFDILNSRNFLNKNIMKKNLCLENEIFIKDEIETSIKYLSTLEDLRGFSILMSQRKTGFLGLIIRLMSVQNSFDEVIKTEMMKFLCTYKLSQDHLEMFFSIMRSRGGFNNNPTAMQFEGAYNRILIHSELQAPEAANCLAQDNTSILNVASSNVMNRNCIDSLNVGDIEAEDLDNMVPFQEITNSMYYSDIVAYIAGFVSRKMMKIINCETCAQSLTTSSTTSALLVRKNRGGLCKPSSDVVKICLVAESIVRSMTNFSMNDHQQNDYNFIEKIEFERPFQESHRAHIGASPFADHVLQLKTNKINVK